VNDTTKLLVDALVDCAGLLNELYTAEPYEWIMPKSDIKVALQQASDALALVPADERRGSAFTFSTPDPTQPCEGDSCKMEER